MGKSQSYEKWEEHSGQGDSLGALLRREGKDLVSSRQDGAAGGWRASKEDTEERGEEAKEIV